MSEYNELMRTLSALGEGARVDVMGRSVLGREIPIVTLGTGKRAVLYVGAMHGTDALVSSVLLDFIEDCLSCFSRKMTQYTYPLEQLFRERSIYIVPMLNPDGVAYVREGVSAENPLIERVCAMNGRRADLTAWRANARGVELSRNFGVGFLEEKQKERERGVVGGAPHGFGGEYPESEPETAALCRMIRCRSEELIGIVTISLGKEGIRCSCEDHMTAKCVATGRVLSRFTGLSFTRGEGARGSLSDWCVRALSRPTYEITCELPREKSEDAARVWLYTKLRRTLFSFPYLL